MRIIYTKPLSFQTSFLGKEDDRIFRTVLEEQESIGYYRLPDAPIDDILEFAANDTHREVVVVGIGWSSLGAKAVYNFLKNSEKNLKPLHFLESTDPLSLLANISRINISQALFLIISKSGNTVETLGIFKYLLSLGSIADSSIIVVTDKESPLDRFALSRDIRTFYLPANVGGRFSVLSAVGILPLALVWIDVVGLLSGARWVKEAFFRDQSFRCSMIGKANFYGKNALEYPVNTLFSYADNLKHFNEWYVQIWGESLGKIHLTKSHVWLTPIGLIGPVDQHSFLQLAVEGPHDKTMTFIKVKDFGTDIAIPDISLLNLESLDIFHSIPFGKLINMQADAIIEQLSDIEFVLDIIELSTIDAENIGALIFYYELLTSLVGAELDIYPYDQPGVEDGKKILKRNVLALQGI